MTTATETLTAGNSGAATTTTTAAAGGTVAVTTASAELPTWAAGIQNPELKTWLSGKKFDSPEVLATSAFSMERLFGADKAGRTVMLPKDDTDAEGWKALNSKLGVPDTADGYKLPLPEGMDGGFAKTAAQWFHKAGVPPRAANQIAEAWNGWMKEQMQTTETTEKAESEKQMQSLSKEWGAQFDAKRELAQRGYRAFAKQFGLDDKAALERAESVLGAANLTRFFTGLGTLNGESGFAGSDAKGGFGLSAAEAQKRVDQITADRSAGKINDSQWRREFEPEMQKLGKILAGG